MKRKNTTGVQIAKKYKLSADVNNIIVQEKYHNKKQDTVEWQNVAYFATPKAALNYVLEKEIREFWVEDLKEVVRRMDEIEKMINGLSLRAS